MDLKAIFDPPSFVGLLDAAEMEALLDNTDPKTVVIKSFSGGSDGEQKSVLSLAVEALIAKYKIRGINIVFVEFTNDLIRNVLNWNCTETFTALLAADIHILPTHFHQGMLAKGGTDTWNMENILSNIQRLRYHLGSPCGMHLDCPVFSQNKKMLYERLFAADLCLPTISVSIMEKQLSLEDHNKIDDFIFKINNDPRWARFKNDDKWVVKLPYTTGSSHGRSAKPSYNGKAGILKSLRQLTNNVRYFGYIDEAIIQPMAHYNKEASVFLFGGKAIFRNPHKNGSIRKSVFDRAPDQVFFDFAEEAFKRLKEVCPELISNQVLRFDFFGDINEAGELIFIVNEVEGYEARAWGIRTNAMTGVSKLKTSELGHWTFEVETLIECHLERVKLRSRSL